MPRIVDISSVLLELGFGESVTEVQRAQVLSALNRAEGMVKRYLKYDPTLAERTEFYPQTDFSLTGSSTFLDIQGSQAVERRVASGVGEALQVRHIPVRSIAHLYVDYDGRGGSAAGAFGAGTEKTEGTDFWPNYDAVDSDADKYCSDGIIRSFGLWPSNPGSVKIVYTAGYTADELAGVDTVIDASPIAHAVLMEAVRLARRSLARMVGGTGQVFAGPLSSESLGDYSYSVGTPDAGMAYGAGTISAEAREMLEPFVNYGYMLAS